MYISLMITSKNRKSLFVQIKEMVWLFYVTKYFPHNYFKYRIFEKNKDVRDFVYYIPGVLYDFIRNDVINNQAYLNLVENKYIFNKLLNLSKLPCTTIYGRYVKGVGYFNYDNEYMSGKDFFKEIEGDFITKPIKSEAQGGAIRLIRVHIDKNEKKFVVNNKTMNLDEFQGYMISDIAKDWSEIMLEKKVGQHEFLNRLNKSSLNTIRIDTLRRKKGDVTILGAFLRVGRSGNHVDNWYQGGLTIGINLEEGCLYEVGYDAGVNKYLEHPDSKINFKGIKIPYWIDVVNKVKQAAVAIPNINSVGWDVAVTENGPVIIEGNSDSGIYPIQLNDRPLLKDKVFNATMREYLKNTKFERKYEKYFNNKY